MTFLQAARIFPLAACAIAWGCGSGGGEDFFDELPAPSSSGATARGGSAGTTAGAGGAGGATAGSAGTSQGGALGGAGTASVAGSSTTGGSGASGGSGNAGGSGATSGAGGTLAGNGGSGGVGESGGVGGGGASAGMGSGGDGAAGTSGSEAGGMAGSAGSGASGDGGVSGNPAGGSGGEQGGMAGKGSGGKGGKPSCAELAADLQDALAAAQVCSNTTDALPCRGFVDDRCGCQVPVNDPNSEATKSYLELLGELNAREDCSVFCTDVLCNEAERAVCLTSGPGNRGQCVARPDDIFDL